MRKISCSKQRKSIINRSNLKPILNAVCNQANMEFYKSILSMSQICYLDETKKYCLVSSDYLAQLDVKNNELKNTIKELSDENLRINQQNRLIMKEIAIKYNQTQSLKNRVNQLQKMNIEMREKCKINNSTLQEFGDQIMKLVSENNNSLNLSSICFPKKQACDKKNVFVQTNYFLNEFKFSYFANTQTQSVNIKPENICIKDCCFYYQQKVKEFNQKINQLNILLNQKTNQLSLLTLQIDKYKCLNQELRQERQEIKKQKQKQQIQKNIRLLNWKCATRKLCELVQSQWQGQNWTINQKQLAKQCVDKRGLECISEEKKSVFISTLNTANLVCKLPQQKLMTQNEVNILESQKSHKYQ